MDSRLSMNMGDNRAGTVLGNVKSVAADIDKLISSALANSARIATNAANSVQGYWSSRSGQNSTGTSKSEFNQPIPNSSGAGMGNTGGGGPNTITPSGGSSGASFGLSKVAAAMGYGFAAMPGVQDQIMQNQLATRAGFFGYGSGGKDARYDQVQALQLSMMRGGVATSTLDSAYAMMAGQAGGIGTGLRNYNNLAAGISQMSNTVPGLGLEGTMQAYVGLQQGRTVNMMRAMGISARDAQGNPRSYTEIANQLWNKLNKEKSVGRAITKEDIANGLLPGNSLDMMLNQIAGNNQSLRSQLEAAIMAKASGAKDFSRSEMQRVGGMSDYTAAAAERTAAAGETLLDTSRAGAAGAKTGAEAMTTFSNALNRATPVLQALAGAKGFTEVVGGGANGLIEKVLGSGFVKSLIGKIPGMASGGSPQANNAYIVGEEGPELFVPKQNGTIIPNHKLNFMGFRKDGGGALSETQMVNYLTQAGFTGSGLEAALKIARAESNWRTGAQGDKSLANEKWGNSVGLFQIRSLRASSDEYYPERNAANLTDPLFNAKAAFKISNGGTNWNAWSTAKKLGLTTSAKGAGATADTYSAAGVADVNELRSVMSSFSGGRGGGSTVTNMGGVTINIVGDKDPKKTAQAVKAILMDEGLLKKTGSS